MRITVVALSILCCVLGCSDPKGPRSISYGCGGGITGGGGGVIIQSDGTVLRYHYPSYRDPMEKWVIGSDPGGVRKLFASFDGLRFKSIQYSKPDNWCCSLTLDEAGSIHSVTWIPEDPSAPGSVVGFASYIDEFVSRFEQK